MAIKFFVPSVITLCERMAKYITRYQAHIEAATTSDQWTCIKAVLDAVNAAVICLKTWVPPT